MTVADTYVVDAVVRHLAVLRQRGLADRRPIRIDGLTTFEAGLVRVGILRAHPTWRIGILAGANSEADGEINDERATRYRNDASKSPDLFVLLAPLGIVVESSLNEPAFYVVARATIFKQALAALRTEFNLSVADVQAVRETAIHSEPEAVYAYLRRWSRLEGSIDPDAPADHLGLLRDSKPDAESIIRLRARLILNATALEVLLRPGLAPGRANGELNRRLGVKADLHHELVLLRAWLLSGRRGAQPRLADFAEWTLVETDVEDAGLEFEPDLTRPPHSGWSDGEMAPAVEDSEGTSKLAWSIRNRRPGLKVEIALIEEISQSVVKHVGAVTTLSKQIQWSRVLGGADLHSTLQDLNPAGDQEGYLFRLRLRLLDGTKLVEDKESNPFQVTLTTTDEADQKASSAPTVWHALYKFHSERAVSPYIASGSPEAPEVVQLRDGGSRKRAAKIDLSPVLAEIERKMLDLPRFAGSWSVFVSQKAATSPSTLDLHRVTSGTDNKTFLDAREAFLALVADSGYVETLDLRDGAVRAGACEYVEAWVTLTEEFTNPSALGHGIANETKLRTARLGSIDTVKVSFAGDLDGVRHEILLVTPFHPTVVAWALGFHDLVHDWSRGHYDSAIKPPYKVGGSGSAVLGGVEGFRAGPRSMVLFTAFENEALPTSWAYSGSVHPLWQAFVRITGKVESRAKEWPEDLARLLGLKQVPAGGNRIDAKRVGSRLKKYAILHPYVRQMRIAALVAGDGQPLLDALRVIDEKPGTPSGAQSIRELRHELQVIGPRSDRLGAAVEDLTSNPGDGKWRGYTSTVLDNPETVLAPGFAFGIHGIDSGSDDSARFWPEVTSRLWSVAGGTNVTIFGPLLTTAAQLVPAPSAPVGYSSRGLVSRPSTVITSAGAEDVFAGNWTLVVPRPDQFATVTASAQHALLRAVDVAGGSVSPDFSIGLGVALAGPVSKALETAHQVSDWVIIADPLFAIELMDRAGTGTDTVLLDYSPEFDAYPGGRVVVSTGTLGELTKLNPTNPEAGLASPALTKVLSSISARLLLSLANPTKQVVRGLHGLALTRVFFRLGFPNALIIPMDGHADMFAVPRVTGTGRLADLLAVSVIGGCLHLAVVESKWVGKANLGKKATDGTTQVRTSMEVLRAEFLEYAGVDRDLRIDALREIILFHLARAKRHELPLPFTREDLLAATSNSELVRQAPIDGHVVVWCPDTDVDYESDDEGVKLVQLGEDQIRRYAVAMAGWPNGELPDADADADTALDAIFEQLIDSTLEDDLAEREAEETQASVADVSEDSATIPVSLPGTGDDGEPEGPPQDDGFTEELDETDPVAQPPTETANPPPRRLRHRCVRQTQLRTRFARPKCRSRDGAWCPSASERG